MNPLIEPTNDEAVLFLWGVGGEADPFVSIVIPLKSTEIDFNLYEVTKKYLKKKRTSKSKSNAATL